MRSALRHGARAEGEGGDGLRAAHLENVVDAQQRRGAEDLRHRPAARPRRCCGTPATCAGTTVISRWRAADSGPPGCRRPRYRAAARSGPAAARAASRASIRAASAARRRRGCWPRPSRRRGGTPARAVARRGEFGSGTRTCLRVEAVELARVFEQRRDRRARRTASRMGRTTASASASRAALRVSRRPTLRLFENATSQHDLVQRILDDALRRPPASGAG